MPCYVWFEELSSGIQPIGKPMKIAFLLVMIIVVEWNKRILSDFLSLPFIQKLSVLFWWIRFYSTFFFLT